MIISLDMISISSQELHEKNPIRHLLEPSTVVRPTPFYLHFDLKQAQFEVSAWNASHAVTEQWPMSFKLLQGMEAQNLVP